MKQRERSIGLIVAFLSLGGFVFLARFLWNGLANGWVPGSITARHYAWSASYTVSIVVSAAALVVYLAFVVIALRRGGVMRPRG